MNEVGRRSLLALGMAGGVAGRPRGATLAVSARPTGLPFHRRDFDMVGVFDLDWLTEPRYARLLDAMAASPGAFGAVRVFGALNAGTRERDFPTASGGTWTSPAAPPDFTATLANLDALVTRGLVPFLPLTFFPPAVSPGPVAPPHDFGPWQRLVRGFLDAAVARYGAAEVSRWWFEVWNEPNMPPFWAGSFEQYLELYRATAEAVRASGHAVRLGGPAIAWMPPDEGPALMERFLRFLRDEPRTACDFLSFHRKGSWAEWEGEPRLSRLVEAAERTAELALQLVPERCARGLVLVNNEADMRVGFQHPYAPRMSERHAAWLAALAATHAALSARHAPHGLRFMAAADNANQHLVEEPFDGRRALMTPTAADRPDDLVKLPVFAHYELLRLLGDGLCQADMLPGGVYRLVTADRHRVAALLAFHPDSPGHAPAPLEVDLVLRDIPWARANLAVFRIDSRHSNAFAAHGSRMPSAAIPPAEARRLRFAAELAEDRPARHGLSVEGGRIGLRLHLPAFATVLAWVTPFSTQLPPGPRRLDASAAHGNVVLRWTPSPDPALYGYELFRSGTAQPIAPVPLRGACWVDTAPRRGVALGYAVRAVSASGLRSALVSGPTLRP
jgi:xylan 1,4-beta-xylosidase